MDEKLQATVSEMLDKAIEGMGKATDFLSAEIPVYVQELLLWKAIYSASLCAIGVALIVVAFIKWPKWLSTHYAWVAKDEDDIREMSYFPLGLVGFTWALFAYFLVNLTWLQIWIAPRVYLVEYAASLAK